MDTLALLERLVAFQTVSRDSNLPLIEFAQTYLRDRGFRCWRVKDQTGLKANLFASIGPEAANGIILSAHTDVVPAAGQIWTGDPFRLRREGERLFGRGTADMKGFLAAALHIADAASRLKLSRPLHIALSHDEEIGCVGVRSLLAELKSRGFSAALCIVGEPTLMKIGVGHKGKLAALATARGVGGHSSAAPHLLNAIHLASDVVSAIRGLQSDIADGGPFDNAFEVPYSTVHAGKIAGGTALNVVADIATVEFEIRHLAEDDPDLLMAQLQNRIAVPVSRHAAAFPQATVDITVTNAYPGFSISPANAAFACLTSWLPSAETVKVSFGTEAGLWAAALAVPTAVIGPGSMEQGHVPNEYIEVPQLAACDEFLNRMLGGLVQA